MKTPGKASERAESRAGVTFGAARGLRCAMEKTMKNQTDAPGAGNASAAIKGLDPRRAALDILERVRDGASLDDALALTRAFVELEGPDRGFARALASTVLRRQGTLDHALGAYIDRPLPKKAARAMDILRLAAAQNLILETPAHAAVSTAVEIAGERKEIAGYAKLINAVARKIAKAGPAAIANLPPRTDTPGWLWRAWERRYGPARARAIAEAHRREAPLDLTLKDPATADQWLERLRENHPEAEKLAFGTLRLKAVRDVRALAGFDEGAWWVQDAAASLPARLLGDVSGKRVFDLCAAPGGKTLQLAAAGAEVVAIDKSGDRLKRLSENLQRTKLQATTIKEDVLRWSSRNKADAILLDAPCTATGTIRRHPDIPWSKDETGLAALTALQARMIDHALTLLKPGGLLVYCVCSLQPEEGEAQAKAALSRCAELARVAIAPEEVGGLAEAVNRDGDMRTLPSMLGGQGGMDGFFAARFKLNG